MIKPIEDFQFRAITGVTFDSGTLQPPVRDMNSSQQAQWNWIMWKRTGGFNSGIADLNGLEASIQELNTLVHIHTNVTVQTQLDSKENSFGPGTINDYLRGDKTWHTLDTSAVIENGNLYFTDARARSALHNSAPITYNVNTGSIGITKSGVATDGYLSSADWNTFNNKFGPTTVGNLTEAVSHVLTVNGGTNCVIGPGTSIQVQKSDATHDGYLSSVDWNTFNNKMISPGVGTINDYLRGDNTWQTLDTSAVSENTNLYYTDARARASITCTVSGLTYTSGTGILSLTTGYIIPTTTQETNWNTAYSAYLAATALNTISTIVKRDASGRTAVSLQDDNLIPKLSVDHNNRLLYEATGKKVFDWSGTELKVFDDSGNNYFSIVRATGVSKQLGAIINNEATLSKYNYQNINMGFSGIWFLGIFTTIKVEIIGYTVTLRIPQLLDTATTASFITTGALPVAYRPTVTLHLFAPRTVNNGADASNDSLIIINTTGVMQIYNGVGNFSGAGSSGFRAFSITYSIL